MTARVINMELSRDNSVPIYQKIKNAINAKIKQGDWLPGDRVPSENQLSTELGASRMTINRSLRELTAEGVLRRVHGLGTFVAEPPKRASLIELRSIAEEIRSQGKQHRSRVLSRSKTKANAEIAPRMNVTRGTPLFHIVVVHYQDDVPIQLESRWVNPAKVPDFLDTDFSQITPTEFLIQRILPDEMEHIVQAVLPDNFMSKHLAISSGEPCLKLNRRTWHDDTVVTVVEMTYPSSRYDLGARYQPEPS